MLPGPPDGFRLNDTHLPHLTLVQQFVQTDRLPAFSRAVSTLSHTAEALALETADVVQGQTALIWRIVRVPALVQLHRRLMNGLRRFDARSGTLDAFVEDDESPRQADLEWVTRYRTRAAYDRFDPHITLGVGVLSEAPAPARFIATRLALCHLGRYCTCRRLIAQWSLTHSE